MFKFPLSKQKIGIDLGTSHTVVYTEKDGLIFNEPTVVAVSIEERKIVAVGNEAKAMIGKVPGNIVAKKPIRGGVIASFKLTQALLEYVILKTLGRSRLIRPEIMISVPAGITTVEERAIVEAGLNAGASTVHLIPEPLAAALGAGLPIGTSTGNMIVNLGGGTSEIAVISMNGIVAFSSTRVGGDDISDAIANYMRRNYNLLIGELMSEQVKITVGSALDLENNVEMEVSGRDIAEGMPKVIKVKNSEIVKAIKPVLLDITTAIRSVLEKTPPELASDVIDRGLVISGGTSRLQKIDELLAKATGVAAVTAEEPDLCVAKGITHALNHIETMRRSLR